MCPGYSLNLQKVDQFDFWKARTILRYFISKCRYSFSCISSYPWMRRLWMTIASTPLTVSIGGTSCFRKTTSYAILPLFFSYFLTARRVRACILLWKVEVSVYYLTTYVEKRPYHSSPRCRSATIRAPSACASSASFRENLRDRAFNSPFTKSHR